MVSLIAAQTSSKMQKDGWLPIAMPHGTDSPIPGLMLFTNAGHDLMMVRSDGIIIDLMKVYRLAEDAMRNGFNGSPDKPGFIADWPRMIALTKALNGEQ
jgi:hypothetical protein